MKKKLSDLKLSEKFIIDKFFNKLNFNHKGTFNFKNDAAYLNISKDYKTIVTTDTIVEKVDSYATSMKSVSYLDQSSQEVEHLL